MDWLLAPFEVGFVARALVAGLLVSAVCALAGTWVVLRGMAFLGDAIPHGMLPGIAIAALLGFDLVIGAAVAAAAMAAGVTLLSRSPRLSQDTSIGLLFVGMLSIGVIIVSRSRSFAVDLTGYLFGDILSVTAADLLFLVLALGLAALIALLGHRAFTALAFDRRKAATLGLRPGPAHAVLCGLLTLAIVASFQVVGTLLVFGLLLAPPAAMALWARRIPVIMFGAAVLGAAATYIGLLASWHFDIAGGAAVAATAVLFFFVSALAGGLRGLRPASTAQPFPRNESEATP